MDKCDVLFVCTGNTCRSPMAEAFFKYYLKNRDPDNRITVQSAGIMAHKGEGASDNAEEAMRQAGIDLSEHSAQAFKPELIENCDLIYFLAPGPLEDMKDLYPEMEEKFLLLGKGVRDPFAKDLDSYKETRDEIELLIKAAVTEVVNKVYNVGA